MQTCLECGNNDMLVKLVDGVPIHECQLCFARFGSPTGVQALLDADEAAGRGIDARIWPLVRVLGQLPGLQVRAGAADAAGEAMPVVDLLPTSTAALAQLENLAKSLRLGAGGLRLPWILQLEYQQHLTVVLKPRADGPNSGRGAWLDVEQLARQFARDQRLGWWRHAEAGDNG